MEIGGAQIQEWLSSADENSFATQNRRSPSTKRKGALENAKHVNTC